MQAPKDKRMTYFLPPLDDATRKNQLMYPTVISDEMIMTRNGVYPRTSKGGNSGMNNYPGFGGKPLD